MIASALRSILILAAVATIAVSAAPASAGTDTLKRSVSNLTLWPLDLVASPVTAGKAVVTNLRDIQDTTAVRVVYALPGFAFLTGLNIGSSVIRGVTGALELLPGIALAFTTIDMDPLFDPVENNAALVDWQNEVFPIKFGIDYATSEF